MFEMITISNDTRIRNDHNTLGSVLLKVPANAKVTGTNLFTAPASLSNAGGVYQKTGDKWLEVEYNGVKGWMAYIHLGSPICKDFKEIIPTDPQPNPTFPESFTLTDPQGNKAEYRFVRLLE